MTQQSNDPKAARTPTSMPPPPPKEALEHIVVPRVATLRPGALAPARKPSTTPPPRSATGLRPPSTTPPPLKTSKPPSVAPPLPSEAIPRVAVPRLPPLAVDDASGTPASAPPPLRRESPESVVASSVAPPDAEELPKLTAVIDPPASAAPAPLLASPEPETDSVVASTAPLPAEVVAPAPEPRSRRPVASEARATRRASRAVDTTESGQSDDGDVVDVRWVLAAAVLAAVVFGTWSLARRDDPGPVANQATQLVPITLQGIPAGARIDLDGEPVSGAPLMVSSGVHHTVAVHFAGHESWRQRFVAQGALEFVVQLEASAPAPPDAPVAVTPDADVAEAPETGDAPDSAPLPAERPVPPSSVQVEPRATTTPVTRMASTVRTPRPSTMRSSHTLVRDPGF